MYVFITKGVNKSVLRTLALHMHEDNNLIVSIV